ncbi:MAG TPA: DUF6580 family putative transport protein [Candidatus Angelobacter sp.]|nr:DUF6580 family putative transport protein [Candidatus Angelobacter sp.]
MLYLYVFAAVLLRLLPHPWNVTPLGAMFLFSGATFRRKWQSLAIPLAALIISDCAVIRVLYGAHFSWFMPYDWAGFLLVGLIGWALRDRISPASVISGSLAGSIIFFVVSNFGVWASGTLYPLNLSGLVTCFTAAIPFFGNTAVGDLFFAAVMFGSYQWIARWRSVAVQA